MNTPSLRVQDAARAPYRRSASLTTVIFASVSVLTMWSCDKNAGLSNGTSGTPDSAHATPDTRTTASDVVLATDQLGRIHITAVQLQPFRPVITTTGTVAFNGDKSTQVLAPVSGPITRILVSPGAYVRRGQALATVTSPDFAAANASFRKAQSAFRNAQRIADLDVQLFKNDAIARREMEQAQTDVATAQADRDAAIEQMRALGVDASTIAAIRDNRGGGEPTSAVIRAPIEGTIVEKLVNPGQLIQAGTTPAFTIADLSTVWVMANVFESDLANVGAGESATITTAAAPTPLTGRVTYVGSLVDPTSKATAVRILAPNPRGLLKRDMLVTVAIRSAQSKNALVIPTSAVLRDDQNLPFVYVVRTNNHFARRQLTLGGRIGDQYEVTAGLNAGDRIVSDGALFLQFAGSQ